MKHAVGMRTELEVLLAENGVVAVELGRVHVEQGSHAALLVPDATRIDPQIVRRTGFAQLHSFWPCGGTTHSFQLDHEADSPVTLAVFPVDLAQTLLGRSAGADGLDAEDRFRIAAYIRAYFGSLARLVGAPDAEEDLRLPQLATVTGHETSIFDDRAALDALLAPAGWRPTPDMLERLGVADGWIRERLLPEILPIRNLQPGLAVFFLRERAHSLKGANLAKKLIEENGFEVMFERSPNLEQGEYLRRTTRGGNWEKGPYPKSGGPPMHLFVVADVFPYPPDATTRRRHPLLDNGRILACKDAVRTSILEGALPRDRFNPLHSTDNSDEAVNLVSSILGEPQAAALERAFRDRLEKMASELGSAEPVGRAGTDFLYARMSDGQAPVLRKIYRPHRANLCARAIATSEALAPIDQAWLRHREGSEGHANFDDPGPGFLPLSECSKPVGSRTIKHLRGILRDAGARGWALDADTFLTSLWVAPDKGTLRVIGAGGAPMTVNTPATPLIPERVYEAQWRPLVGMPQAVLLESRPSLLFLWLYGIRPVARAAGRLRRPLSRLRQILRR